MNKIRKCFDKTFRREEYFEKEAIILATLDFDISIPTFVDFLIYYISKGVSFNT
jgi:hypothetical protein